MSLLFTEKFPRTKTSVMNIHSYYPRIYQVITIYQVIIKSALSALENWKGNLSGTRKGKLIFVILILILKWISSVQFRHSVVSICDTMNRSMPGLPVHHQLPEFTETHVHCVGDAIQPSRPLSSPSPPAFNLSQNQGLFK